MRVRRFSGALGAEVDGVDLARPLPAAEVDAIRSALLEHLVVFFRDQDLTPGQFLGFAAAFGEPMPYPMLGGLPGLPTVTEVAKLEHETVNFGGVWHSDTTYLDSPPMATLLIAREVPPQGGDTLFANMHLAYEGLSAGMRHLLDPLRAISSSAKAEVSRTREDRRRDAGLSAAASERLAEHPVVRTHPETGRKALFVNTAHTLRFADMTEAGSAPLLDHLFAHQIRPEFCCRFAWRRHSIAFWDNRAAQHYPVNDYHGYRRVMHRVTLRGDRPA